MAERSLRWWVRLDIELESYYGPFEQKVYAEKFAAKEKCSTEVLQDVAIDNGYLEFSGGSWESPSRFIVFRSGKVRPFSDEAFFEWAQKQFGHR